MAMLCWEHDDNDRRLDFLGTRFLDTNGVLDFSWTPQVSCIIPKTDPASLTLRDVAKRTGGQVGFHFHHHIVPRNLSSTGPGWVLDDLFRSLGMASNGENPMAELNRTQVSQAAF